MEPKTRSLPVTFPATWVRFAARFEAFLEKEMALRQTVRKVFARTAIPKTLEEKTIFSLGSVIPDEFSEILLLCANGYGIAGYKLLRSVYEKAVTASYLSLHPDKCCDFVNYSHVNIWRLYNHSEEVIGASGAVSAHTIEEIKRSYERVKGMFEKSGKPGKRKVRGSWSDLDLVSMACKAEESFRDLYAYCYYQPTLQAHATLSAVLARIYRKPDGHYEIGTRSQEDQAVAALCGAHGVLLLALQTQNAFFKLDLNDEINARIAECGEVWKNERSVKPSLDE